MEDRLEESGVGPLALLELWSWEDSRLIMTRVPGAQRRAGYPCGHIAYLLVHRGLLSVSFEPCWLLCQLLSLK